VTEVQARRQNDAVYRLPKTASVWGQIKIKQISRSWILIIFVLLNYYTAKQKKIVRWLH